MGYETIDFLLSFQGLFCNELLNLTICVSLVSYFRYPERPLIFLSACYVGRSLGYLVRIVVGGREEVACDGNVIRYGAAPSLVGGVGGGFVGVSSSTSSPSCVVTFLLVYFFGQAAGLW